MPMDEELSPKEISLRLDTLLGQYMSNLEKSIQLRENLSQVLKNGHFNISKAKYSMGPLAVSQYKYPGIIHPSSIISVDSSSKETCYTIKQLLNTETNTITKINSSKLKISNINNNTDNKNNNNNNNNNSDEKENEENHENDKNKKSNNDADYKATDEHDGPAYNAPILMGGTSKDSPSGASKLRRRKTDSNNSSSSSNSNSSSSISGGSPSSSSGGSSSSSSSSALVSSPLPQLIRTKKVKDDERSADDLSIVPPAYSNARATTTKKNGKGSSEKEKIERMLAAMKFGEASGGTAGDDSSDDEEEEVKYKNPLNWFGVLVPQNLRQAQSEFSKAVELIVEIANVVHQMEVCQKEYFKLLSIKNTE